MGTKLPPSPVGVPPGHSFWNDWYEKLRTLVNAFDAIVEIINNSALAAIGSLILYSDAVDPTSLEIDDGYAKLYKNTTTDVIKLWVNDGGTMKSVTLS